MTQEEYFNTDWHRGNAVRLNNGKEYPVKKVKKRFLLLYSEEYDSYFVADHNIIVERTSDFIDDTPKMPKTPKTPEPAPTPAPAVKSDAVAAKLVDEPVAKEKNPEVLSKAKPTVSSDAPAPVKKKRPRIARGPVVEKVKI